MKPSVDYISGESLYRPEVVRWRRRIEERYIPPEDAAVAVLLPCSATKPYSASPSHRRFIAAIKRGAKGKRSLVHEAIMTSPLALVPRELENLYPACCYDTTVTGHWSEEEKEVLAKAIRSYAAKFKGELLCYAGEAYAEVCESLGIDVIAKDNLLSEDSLKALEERIREALMDKQGTGYNPLEPLRKVADVQFGLGAGKALICEGARVRRGRIFYKGEQVAAISERHGYLALTLRGGELLRDFSGYVVELSFFPKSNNIFTPGIEHAGEDIRPGDEVIVVYGDEVVGVGKALLNGSELAKAERGLGVVLRHRRKAA
jgi:archaeosine synthase